MECSSANHTQIKQKLMKEFKYTINGNKYEVAVGEVQGNNVEITVNGETYSVELEPKPVKKERVKVQAPVPAKKVAVVPAAGGSAGGGDPLKSPLPGTIKDICVAVGDEVKEGQTVVVLEAMKMANNLEAERDGKVVSVNVAIGDTVMEGAVLVTFE